MMDLSTLAVPDTLRQAAEGADHNRDVVKQPISVNSAWWRDRLPDGGLASQTDKPALTRSDLFGLGERAQHSTDGALELLWASLSWGTGTSQRNNSRRVDAVTSTDGAPEALRKAATLAQSDPRAAYESLRPKRNLVPYLGPPFFTKYLYFAGAGEPGHPSLILDSRVAASLRGCGWKGLTGTYSWPAATYERYCQLVRRWSSELTRHDSLQMTPDQIELWLFHGSEPDMPGEEAAGDPALDRATEQA